jgi:hypothetical protein
LVVITCRGCVEEAEIADCDITIRAKHRCSDTRVTTVADGCTWDAAPAIAVDDSPVKRNLWVVELH